MSIDKCMCSHPIADHLAPHGCVGPGEDEEHENCPCMWAPVLATFGDRLRHIREYAGWTQAQLGAQIGKPKQNLLEWEKGRAEPSLETIEKLAEALNVSAGWLAFGEEK